MILRRIAEHVKAQNWTAVALDFVIVVSGVVIGLQVSNWNDARSDRRDYEAALDRLRTETASNLQTISTLEDELSAYATRITEGFDALLSCNDTPENRRLAESALNGITGTLGVALKTRALTELTENEKLLSEQAPDVRQRLSKARFRIDTFLREADFAERIPLEERVQNNPVVKVGENETRDVSFFGIDYSRPQRRLSIGAPLEQACKDDKLLKSYYTWERWQTALFPIMRILRESLEDISAVATGAELHEAHAPAR
jgi:hypothetical protein